MKTALLIIDVQSGMFDHEPRADQADAVIARLNQLATAARAAGTPVVWVQHERASPPLTHGSAEWRLARGLDAQPDDHYLRKTTPDSFLRTGLHEQLQQWGVGQLVIAGYASEFCIDTTTRSAAAHGYAIILVSDAHTTHDKDHASAAQIRAHENATLPKLGSFGVPILLRAAAEIAFPANA